MSSKEPSRSSSSTRQPGETRPPVEARQPARLQLEPGLYIVSTPIGNLRDITLRALDTLASVDEVLAEDTRVARRLLAAHCVEAKLTAYHDHNAALRRPELLRRLGEGACLALISDAGTPLVSDPGYKLVREAAEAGVRIVPVPGASALLAGIAMAGLPSDRFLFAGFLPPKSGGRRKALRSLARLEATLVFYEGPSRLAACLADLAETLGPDREGVVARELTKLFEEARRGTLTELAEHYSRAGPPKGEVVILAGPPTQADTAADPAEVDAALRAALAAMPTRAAADAVAGRFALSRREVYQRALALKDDG